ncbi:hypothetical protein, partial [Aeromonas salmonicida]|uniref:hypothetical protein n=1 Tax=Aeromonas salmonicida TaxID=645 RepID=UPI00195B03C0
HDLALIPSFALITCDISATTPCKLPFSSTKLSGGVRVFTAILIPSLLLTICHCSLVNGIASEWIDKPPPLQRFSMELTCMSEIDNNDVFNIF